VEEEGLERNDLSMTRLTIVPLSVLSLVFSSLR
jgi:hypothetical protein